MGRPSRGGEKRTAVWASHHEERGGDGAVAPPRCDHRVVLNRCVGREWCRATLCPRGRSSLGRPASRPFLRNAWPDLTTIVPVTAYYRINCVRDTVGLASASPRPA